MDKQDLLLEIGCEELPTHAVKSLSQELHSRLSGIFNLHQLNNGQSTDFCNAATNRGLYRRRRYATSATNY